MENWFGASSDHPFQVFSSSHLAVLTIALIGVVCLLLVKGRLRMKGRLFQWLRWFLFAILFSSEVTYQYWAITNFLWSFSRHVPLHLCGIASVTAMVGLLTLRPFWVQISFFIGILPAFLALVTPDLPYDYHHYRFWKFFIHHTAISWTCLFLALSFPGSITFRSVISVYTFLLVYAAFIGFLVNPVMGSNYLYLMQRPGITSPLDFFGEGIWYYINLCLAALLLFSIQYAIFRWRIKGKEDFL